MLDKERRKKKRGEVTTSTTTTGAVDTSMATTSSNHYGNGSSTSSSSHHRNDNMDEQSDHTKDVGQATFHKSAVSNAAADDLANKKRQKNINSNSSIHTEIRTDDFVVRLLLSMFSIYWQFVNLLSPPILPPLSFKILAPRLHATFKMQKNIYIFYKKTFNEAFTSSAFRHFENGSPT